MGPEIKFTQTTENIQYGSVIMNSISLIFSIFRSNQRVTTIILNLSLRLCSIHLSAYRALYIYYKFITCPDIRPLSALSVIVKRRFGRVSKNSDT